MPVSYLNTEMSVLINAAVRRASKRANICKLHMFVSHLNIQMVIRYACIKINLLKPQLDTKGYTCLITSE